MAARIVALANQKGGSGKTTVAVNLACALGETGQSVLLVDADPQADATNAVGIDSAGRRTLYDVMGGEATAADTIVRQVAPNVDLLPGSERMGALEAVLVSANFREQYLANALAPALDSYDVVLIDCPPNLGVLSVNALVAADDVVVVVNMLDRNAYKGAHALRETIDGLRRAGINTRLVGVVRNSADTSEEEQRQRKVYRAINAALEADGALPVLHTEIPMRADFQTATLEGVPLMISRPDGAGARAIRNLALELASTAQAVTA